MFEGLLASLRAFFSTWWGAVALVVLVFFVLWMLGFFTPKPCPACPVKG
jgi:hypothetical protein